MLQPPPPHLSLLAVRGLTEDPGPVWPCLLSQTAVGLDSAGAAAAEEELLKEALLMAQVDAHPHLVSIVGVITRGVPKVLVLSFCEHGELQGALIRHGADGEPFPPGVKYRFCKEIADGMQHLAERTFVHRDLAARNILLGTGMVCKVADFGLSRRVQTDDNTGDYYRSTSGVLPVRWTSPEGLTNQKFSSASDVWSYGITCIEIFSDGAKPYPDVASNPEIFKLVSSSQIHPQPAGCPDQVYEQLKHCFQFDPDKRPGFATLVAFFRSIETSNGAIGPAGGSRVRALPLRSMHVPPARDSAVALAALSVLLRAAPSPDYFPVVLEMGAFVCRGSKRPGGLCVY